MKTMKKDSDVNFFYKNIPRENKDTYIYYMQKKTANLALSQENVM